MSQQPRPPRAGPRWLHPVVAVMMLAGSLIALSGGAGADVAQVSGGAFGYFSNVALSGNPPPPGDRTLR